MPAVLDDPASPTIYRVSGAAPFPNPAMPLLPGDMAPRQVTLRDRQTVATIVPFASRHQLPRSLLGYLCDQLNKEIEGGDTYPMTDAFSVDGFARYWFQNFGAVMLLGPIAAAADVVDGKDWSKECLGSFYIKPNYPGRSSHVCNAGFLVTDASRNRGVGRLMGESYIDWAPRLGYTYSVFNLVYETNVASCRIWDALGFKRIGRVKGCGNLRGHPGRLIDAIIYGRDLAPGESEELVSEERFDKIKFYLKYGKYPNGADRAEKSRLRSAATHYKLLDDDKLMLKDKEVISDPAQQYDIARAVHVLQHGGINKTTATIAEKYHWSRIKETVSDVIRNCVECKDLGKAPNPGSMRKAALVNSSSGNNTGNNNHGGGAITTNDATQHLTATTTVRGSSLGSEPSRTIDPASTTTVAVLSSPTGRPPDLQEPRASAMMPSFSQTSSTSSPGAFADPSDITAIAPSRTLQNVMTNPHPLRHHQPLQHHTHVGPMLHNEPDPDEASVYQPIDPQIINNTHNHDDHDHHHHHHTTHHDNPFDHYHAHAEDFQALLNATEDDVPGHQDSDAAAAAAAAEAAEAAAAVDRDLEMLLDHQDDDDHDDEMTESNGPARVDDTVIPGAIGKGERDRDIYDLEFDGPGG